MRRRLLPLLLIALAEMGQMSPPVMMRPQAMTGDARIRTVTYVPDRVVPLQGAMGFAVVIELSDDEHVENVVVGNSAGWQVVANKRGDHLIVKPTAAATTTDMVVTTDVRSYVFLLQLADASETVPFVVHFTYPEMIATAPPPSSVPMASYKLQGDKALYPTAISDDGQRTTIAWSRNTTLPAVFAADAKGNEAIVNGRMVDGVYVIQSVASRYVFRLGKAHATATRRLDKKLG